MIDTQRHLWPCAVWLAWFVSPALAQDAASAYGVSYGFELAVRSGQADRGFIISDRPVVQPATWVTWSGAELSVWTSVPLTPNGDGSRPQIVELELGRQQKWGKFTIAPAARMYFYRDALSRDRDRSLEGWLNLSYDIGAFRLFTNHSLDLQTYRGAYFVDAGVESEQRVTPSLEIGGSLGAGFGSARFNYEYAGVPLVALDRIRAASWLTAHLKRFYVGAHVEYSSIVDRAVRAGAEQPTYVLVRLAVGGEF